MGGTKPRDRGRQGAAACIRCLSPRLAGRARVLDARPGQSLVELSITIPIFLLLVMGIVGLGITFEKKLSMDNAARSGARYAAVYPDALSPSQPAPSQSIEGHIQNDGSTISIPNDGTGITIKYLTPSSDASGTATLCGSYDPRVTSGPGGTGWVPASGTSNTPASCMVPFSLIQVTLTSRYSIPVPLLSAVFRGGITIQTSSTMMEEQACDPTIAPSSSFCS